MRLQHLLREMARKYDQYDDYMQQDAHELLRHLLDSMEMEEKDIIKRVQPTPPGRPKGIISTNSPAPSAPGSPTRSTFEPNDIEIPEHKRLVPFVDVLFGGLLASVVVCEHCKSVSVTSIPLMVGIPHV